MLGPADPVVDAGLGQSALHVRRRRGIRLSAGASVAAKAASTVVGIAAVPIALSYLGKERYGIWLTISSSLLLLGFMDLGMGNAVMTAVSRTRSGDDRREARELVSTGFFILLAIAIVGSILVVLGYWFVPWPGLLGTSDPMGEVAVTVSIVLLLLMANLPLGVAGKTEWGMQQGYVNSSWQVLGALLSLSALLLVVHSNGGMPFVAAAIASGAIIANLLNTAWTFGRSKRWLRPKRTWVTMRSRASLLRLGIMFLGLQLALVGVFAVDNLIIARTLGADVVPDYAVPYRMFAFVLTIVGLAVNPLWPAFGDALADGDDSWVRRTLAKAVGLTVTVSSILATLLVFAGSVLLGWWTNDEIRASMPLLIGLAVWVVAQGLASTISMFLNGAAVMRFQLITFWCMAFMAITLKLALVPSIGIAAAAWANAAAVVVCVIIPDAIYVPGLLSRVTRSRSALP